MKHCLQITGIFHYYPQFSKPLKTIFKQLYRVFLDTTLLYNPQQGFRTDH